MHRYQGSCHCGAVRFEIQGEPITTACMCNCSMCRRRNALMSDRYFSPETFHCDPQCLNNLTRYRFGDHLVNHYFCTTCGVYPFHDAVEKPGYYRVNLGCLQDLDPGALAITQIDGRSF